MNAHNNIHSRQTPVGLGTLLTNGMIAVASMFRGKFGGSDRLMAYLGLILIGAIGWIGDHLLRAEIATKKAR